MEDTTNRSDAIMPLALYLNARPSKKIIVGATKNESGTRVREASLTGLVAIIRCEYIRMGKEELEPLTTWSTFLPNTVSALVLKQLRPWRDLGSADARFVSVDCFIPTPLYSAVSHAIMREGHELNRSKWRRWRDS
jgi:hypothetical protein